MNENSKQYDLEERTAKFGENIIDLCQQLRQDVISRPLISQLIRSSTSIGANYMEANGAISKKDFTNKIFICRKECQETRHWLRMLIRCCPDIKDKIIVSGQEAQELTLIFGKIGSSLKKTL